MKPPPPSSARRILYLNSVSAIGGAEESLLETIRSLDRTRFSPSAVVPGPGPLADRLALLDVPVRFLPLHRFRKTFNPFLMVRNLWNIRQVSWELVEQIQREGIDLIHSNSATAHLYGGRAAGHAGIPCIWHCRDLVRLGWLEGWLARNASVVVAISRTVARHLERRGPLPNLVGITNALDADAFAARAAGAECRARWGFGPEHFVVGMAAHLAPWKRHDLFLDAAARIAAACPEARFVVAGGDPFGTGREFDQALRRQADRLGLGERLVWTGVREDMPSILDAFDVLVHPASREPLGRVILEALALGKPVVAPDAAGPAEILAGGAGRLVVPDDAEALAEAVLELRRNPAWARAFGEAGRRRVRAVYGPRSHAVSIENLYATLASASPRVAMVTAAFPCLSETFILRDMMALERRGVGVVPVSMDRRSLAWPVHQEAIPFLRRTIRPSLIALAMAPFYYLVRHPRRLAAAARVLREAGAGWKGPYRLALAAAAAKAASERGAVRVHAQFAWVTADIGKAMARLMEAPFSLSVHARDLFVQPAESLRQRAEGSVFVACCTRLGLERMKACVPGLGEDRLALVRHGVFPELYGRAESDKPRILAVGRLEAKKGFDVLVKACVLLRQRGLDFVCAIAGDGPEAELLEHQVHESGLEGRVHLAGPKTQEQLKEWYGRAMVMAIPSVEAADGDRDGVPNVLLEAMAAGLPVVASAAGAIPEAVTDGVEGLLVPPGDPGALAGALERLLADGDQRRRMGENGRARVRREFDADRNAAALAELFDRT